MVAIFVSKERIAVDKVRVEWLPLEDRVSSV
jgi:hypothetical protein